jgi:hypothetical protein
MTQTVALGIYLAAFAIALGVFVTGHHKDALAIVFVAWAVLSAWQYFGGAR